MIRSLAKWTMISVSCYCIEQGVRCIPVTRIVFDFVDLSEQLVSFFALLSALICNLTDDCHLDCCQLTLTDRHCLELFEPLHVATLCFSCDRQNLSCSL